MKRLYKYLVILLMSSVVVGCQTEFITYTDDASGIYFDKLNISAINTEDISFGLTPSNIGFIKKEIQVNLIGQVVDYDREFIFEAEELTEDYIVLNEEGKEEERYKPALAKGLNGRVDYEILAKKFIIKAGENKAIIDINFYRTDIMATKEMRMVSFVLKENTNFKFLFPTNMSDIATTKLTFTLNEKVAEPWWWKGKDNNGEVIGLPIFGEYSIKKSLMIADRFDIDRTKWTTGNLPDLGGRGTLMLRGTLFQMYLNEMDEAGTPIMDENGEPMTMGEDVLNNM